MNKKQFISIIALLLVFSLALTGFAYEEEAGEEAAFANWDGAWNSITFSMSTDQTVIDALYAAAEATGVDGDAFYSEYSSVMLQPLAAVDFDGDTMTIYNNVYDENGDPTGEAVFEGTYALTDSENTISLFELQDEVAEDSPENNFRYLYLSDINLVDGALAFQMIFSADGSVPAITWLPTMVDCYADSESIAEYLVNFTSSEQAFAASESYNEDSETYLTEMSDHLMPIAPLFE